MRVGILAETDPFETRCVATPASVSFFQKMGLEVYVQSGLGAHADFSDDAYQAAGAQLVENARQISENSNLILKLNPPLEADIYDMMADSFVVSMFDPYRHANLINLMVQQHITSLSMSLMPRITRAQSMDIISSQANIAGYRAVIDAAAHFNKVFPLMMTPAGTVPATRVFVMGAGVAGLQAIATAKRLGAIVSATDVRPATKEQVLSLGAQFIAVEDDEFRQAESDKGYAKPMSKTYQRKQAELIQSHLATQDIVITTALIPNAPAPKLITLAMVESMRPSSVIIDLAAEHGGNCELTQPNQNVLAANGVKIIGSSDMRGVPTTASELCARNFMTFIQGIYNAKEDKFVLNLEDEIIKATALTHLGKLVHITAS